MVDVNFDSREVRFLDRALGEISTAEQTQEIKLPDGMPDIAQVVCAWGQPILRGKEWRSDSISFSGGMMVWVLYRPEDGSGEKCIDAWIPFQMKWDLPPMTPEGRIRLQCIQRFVDARTVSPRKIMVRAGIGVQVEALVKKTGEVFRPEPKETPVELLQVAYPVRLPREAGEKTFLLEEPLSLPEACPQPEKILCYRAEGKVTDKKVLAEKLVFRGQAMVHVVYETGEGKIASWDFEAPFSQFAELDQEHSTDAQAGILLGVTNLETELEEGAFHIKCGMVAQYLVTDRVLLDIIEDAYCPGRETELSTRILELPVVLDSRKELLAGESWAGGDAAAVADTCYLPDLPRQMGAEMTLTVPGTVQVLYYDAEGGLQQALTRQESQLSLPADPLCRITAIAGPAQVQVSPGSGGIQIKTELPMDVNAMADQGFAMVTGVTLGEATQPDPGRPSLILRRAGTRGLWDMARDCGSTVEAIRQANALQGEPVPGQMLLIPVP